MAKHRSSKSHTIRPPGRDNSDFLLFGNPDEPLIESFSSIRERWDKELDALAKHPYLSTDLKESKTQLAKLLAYLAVAATERLDEVMSSDFEAACQAARSRPSWPVIIDPSAKSITRIQKLRKQLSIGSEFQWVVNKKKTPPTEKSSPLIAFLLVTITDCLRFTHFAQDEHSKMRNLLDYSLKNKHILTDEEDKKIIRRFTNIAPQQMEYFASLAQTSFSQAYKSVKDLETSFATASTITNEQLLGYIDAASALSPFNDASVNEWVDFGRKIILALTNDAPEKNAALRAIGEPHATKYLKSLVKQKTASVDLSEVDKLRKSGRAAATGEANIRNGIFTMITSAYKTLAKTAGKGVVPAPSDSSLTTLKIN
jgi:hypothetical protein